MATRISSSLFLMSSRRAFSVASEKIKAATTTGIRKVVEACGKEEAYWMRDPKTGNWMPENHFEDVNVADLRSQFLSKKPTSSSSD